MRNRTAIVGILCLFWPAILSPGEKRPSPELVDKIVNTLESAAKEHELDPDMIKAVAWVESSFNPGAISPKGAIGLMQVMPANFGVCNMTNDPFNVRKNVRCGTKLLRGLLDYYGKDRVDMALAAYNAGRACVNRRISALPSGAPLPMAEDGVVACIPSKTYVRKVFAVAEQIRSGQSPF